MYVRAAGSSRVASISIYFRDTKGSLKMSNWHPRRKSGSSIHRKEGENPLDTFFKGNMEGSEILQDAFSF